MFKYCNTFIFITLITALIVSGCDIKQIEGGKELAVAIEKGKVKRFTKDDILKATQKAGDSIVAVAKQELDERLQQRLATEGVVAAMAYCQPQNYEAVEALEKKYGASTNRTSSKLRNPQHAAPQDLAPLLAKYEQAVLKEPQVLELNEQDLVYTAPIYIRNETCLRCHGTPGQEVLESDYQIIKQQYPSDEAINYKQGDLRGMWYIRFSKKGIVSDLTIQPKKKRKR